MVIDFSQWDLGNVDLGNVSMLPIFGRCTTCNDVVPIHEMTPNSEPLCPVCCTIAQPRHTTSSKPSDDTKYHNALRLQRDRSHPRRPKR
jgi:hypothetical protein